MITLDSNNDRVLNSRDAAWSQLRIWRDLDQDGVGDAGELRALSSYRIASIDLNFRVINVTAAGSLIHEQSVYRLDNGQSRAIVDAWLSVNRALTAYEKSDGLPAAINALPDMRGSGDLPNLRVAAAADQALLNTLKVFAALTPTGLGAWPGLIEDIIYRWAGVENVATNSRGPNFDGRKLAAIEAFLGRAFERNGLRDPVPQTVADLQATWNGLFQKVAAALLVQGPLEDFLAATLVVPGTGGLISALALSDHADDLGDLISGLPLREAAQILSAFRPVAREMALEESLTNAQLSASLTAAADAVGLGAFQAAIAAGSREGVAHITGSAAMHLFGDAADSIGVQGRQIVFAGAGNDLIVAGTDAAGKAMDGEAGNDTIYGGPDADVIVGGAGVDLMLGGAGNDLYRVDSTRDRVVELPNSGADTIESSIALTLPDHVEALVLLGDVGLLGRGNAAANTLIGTARGDRLLGLDGDDLLDGRRGADTMTGGRGNDTYRVDDAGDVVVENRNTDGIDLVESSVSYTLGRFVEHLTLTGDQHIAGTANESDNILRGNTGNNRLDGRGGRDTMVGGAGNDTYIVNNASDLVVEEADAGRDVIEASVSVALAAHVEWVLLTGEADLNATGNTLDNLLRGNSGSNRLRGNGGADTMEGGQGDDTYHVDSTTDRVLELADGGFDLVETTIDYTLGDWLEAMLLLGNAGLAGTGNALDNEIMGNGGANTLTGVDGNDHLNGAAGNDLLRGGLGDDTLLGGAGVNTLEGGAGNDLYVLDSAADMVIEGSNGGIDTVHVGFGYVMAVNIENAVLTGNAAMDLLGNGAANLLIGNDAANNLVGGGGIDTMMGLGGNDAYDVDRIEDLVIEQAGGGTDLIRSSVDLILVPHIENLELLGGALKATGNDANNLLIGNANRNILTGGRGTDTLEGRAGSDRFVWNDLAEGAPSGGGMDVILDFSRRDQDRIVVTAIDANELLAGNQAFDFIGTAAFTAAGQVRIAVSGTQRVAQFNTDADLLPELGIIVRGIETLEAQDFLL